MITEEDGRFVIKCQIKDKYKVAKPEEIVRQLWIYRLRTEYGLLQCFERFKAALLTAE